MFYNLKMMFMCPERGNLISVVVLDFDGYTCSFGNRKFDLLYNLCVVGSSALFDMLY